MHLTKNVKNILTITVLAAALYGASFLIMEKTLVPQNFTDARITSAKTAGELMAILGASQLNLSQISEFHKNSQFFKALELVRLELENGKQSLAKSQQLAAELNSLANFANGITPIKARNLAVEAIKLDLAIMGKLIQYNTSFNSLLEILQLKFSGAITADNSAEIQTQLENMNSLGKEINDLNELRSQKMAEFDKLTAK